MRIAVQNPSFLFQDQKKNFNGYNYCFLRKYADLIYSTDPRRICRYKRWAKDSGSKMRVSCDPIGLNKQADILICFNGHPYRPFSRPSMLFNGLKIYHVMDYVFYPKKANKALRRGNVEYVMAYCDHYSNDPFFRKYYPYYSSEKIIQVPFGFGERFRETTPFSKRKNKAIALGSVNPVRDLPGKILEEYQQFHHDEQFTHKLRRAVVLNREAWGDCVDDLLPTYPKTKNPDYDPVVQLNQYTMFINDAGLMEFPPARTYEGIAAGCVMVAEDLPIWKELGFENDVNCILFEKNNYEQMVSKIRYYSSHFEQLQDIQKRSVELSKGYTHEHIADALYEEVRNIYNSRV